MLLWRLIKHRDSDASVDSSITRANNNKSIACNHHYLVVQIITSEELSSELLVSFVIYNILAMASIATETAHFLLHYLAMAIVSSLHHNQRRSRSTAVAWATSVQYCGSNPSPDIKVEPHTLPVCSSTLTPWGPRSQPQHYESREQHPPCSKSQQFAPPNYIEGAV